MPRATGSRHARVGVAGRRARVRRRRTGGRLPALAAGRTRHAGRDRGRLRARRAARCVMSTNPDRLAELEEERRFLLRSLADLEREHDAGDVDVDDYQTFRDGYTVRAASVLRSIEDGPGDARRAPPAGNWRRHLVVAVVVRRRGGWSRLVRRPVVRATPRRTGALRTRPTRRDPGAARAGAGGQPRGPCAGGRALRRGHRDVIPTTSKHSRTYGWTTALTAATTSDTQAAR